MLKKTLAVAALLVASLSSTAIAQSAYELQIKAPSAKANRKAAATIRVTPTGDFHINKTYPTRLTVNAPEGVKITKQRLSADDAVKLNDSELEFKVDFKAVERGTHKLSGELRFATCREDSCQQYTRKIAIEVEVK